MAVERMTIIDVEPGYLHVSARQPVHCTRCAVKTACGRHLLEDLWHRPARTLKVTLQDPFRDQYRPGDTLEVSLDDTTLTRISLLLYLPPLACLLMATALANHLAAGSGAGELWVILAAVAALAAGFKIMPVLTGRPGTARMNGLSPQIAVVPAKSPNKEH